MTVKQLIDKLEDFSADCHVVVAVVPGETLTVGKTGIRLELEAVRIDRHTVVNIIVKTSAGHVDHEIQEEARG